MKTLSPMRRQILDYIQQFVALRGYPPSVREICEGVGLKSPSTVHNHLNILRAGGYLAKDDRKTRTLKIVGSSSPDADRAENIADYMAVPVLGRVTAGLPILAVEEEVSEYIPFKKSAGEYFALRVRGDSMIGAGIFEGDIIIVRRQPTARHGEIVVALLEDEATVKRLWRKNGDILLMPENDRYEPIPGKDASILGVVCAVWRDYHPA